MKIVAEHCGAREKTRLSYVGFWQRMAFRWGSGNIGANKRLNNEMACGKRRMAARVYALRRWVHANGALSLT